MVYVYKKSDREKKNPIYLSDAVKYKSLWNEAEKIEKLLNKLAFGQPGLSNLLFDGEDEETKRDIYKAIHCVKSFKENLRLKDNIEV